MFPKGGVLEAAVVDDEPKNLIMGRLSRDKRDVFYRLAKEKATWSPELCVQCGACSLACPQGALRMKVFEDQYLESAPKSFKSIISNEFDLMNYTIQINPEQCNSCNNCVDACPSKALSMIKKSEVLNSEKANE